MPTPVHVAAKRHRTLNIALGIQLPTPGTTGRGVRHSQTAKPPKGKRADSGRHCGASLSPVCDSLSLGSADGSSDLCPLLWSRFAERKSTRMGALLLKGYRR